MICGDMEKLKRVSSNSSIGMGDSDSFYSRTTLNTNMRTITQANSTTDLISANLLN